MGLSQTRRVRVLLINQVFHPDPQATSQYLSSLAEELATRGHEVTVLTGSRDYDDPERLYPRRETWRGIEIIRRHAKIAKYASNDELKALIYQRGL